MASLNLSHIYKVYPNGLKAVNDFSMDIEDREFIVFVGPSGCGKSTTLRMIAGLEEITAGELRIGGEVVNDEEPKDRDIAMVFQNYALYPHMSVFDNMAFGLSLRHISKDEIRRRVNEAAKILGITDYLQKKPKEMSGGQRQRVALGRAMVREPKVFLLDEPLSNLDAKLRTQMRSEILKLHERIKTTFIYVTHDQVEAMTMGTRIVVMRDGFVQQIDTPRNLYSYPCNKFVAGFIGTPQMNFYDGTIVKNGNTVTLAFKDAPVEFTVPAELLAKADWRYLDGKRPVTFGIRSEHISTDPDKYPYKAKCRVSYCEDLGVDSQVYADFNIDDEEASLDSVTKVVIKAPAATLLDKDSVIDVSLDLSNLHIFDAKTEVSIAPRIPQKTAFNGVVKGGKLVISGAEFALPPSLPLEDGEYIVEAPIDAISFGGKIKVKIEDGEDIGGITLTRVSSGDGVFFVRTDKGSQRGKTVGIDLKLCNFLVKKSQEELDIEAEEAQKRELAAAEEEAQKEEEKPKKGIKAFFGRKKKKAEAPTGSLPPAPEDFIPPEYRLTIAAMPTVNVLECSFKRFKTKEQVELDGKQTTVGVKKYSIGFLNPDIEPEPAEDDTQVAAAEKPKPKKEIIPTFDILLRQETAQKIMTGAGRLADKDVLQVMFSPYAVRFADDGINGTVEAVADYGAERFYICIVNGETVYVADDGASDYDIGDNVKIVPDLEKSQIHDKTIDIRLV